MVHFIFIAPMHSYVTNVLVYNLHMTIFSRVYSYVLVCTRMLLVCTRMLLVCYSYVLVCARMLLVCTRMLLVCSFSHNRLTLCTMSPPCFKTPFRLCLKTMHPKLLASQTRDGGEATARMHLNLERFPEA